MFQTKIYLHLFGILLIFLVTFPICAEFSQRSSTDGIKYNAVKSWAEKLGLELWHLGDFITRRKDVQESFETAQVVSRVGSKIVENMANEIRMMMELKISAIKRIMDTAENTALAHQNEPVNQNHSYYNAKEMLEPGEAEPTEPPIPDTDDCGVPKIKVPPKRIFLVPKQEFFDIPVNVSVSSVQVPTNVFDRASEVIHSIQWSENLDQTFRDNYKKDPTLSWQFFGSATGFLRQFPASKWGQDPVDLYDCRLRSWFIEAATSPKDMIILMDGSGSMTGQRLDIAKAVVRTILDTLGTNDFVNIYTFGEHVKPVVPCFQDVLAQATLGNIREFKKGIDQVKTEQMANFTAALIKAFDILELYRTESFGARCNQAIMIISDGAPFSYSDIFEQYNWQNLPYKPVRVFTYLIGKEVADVKEIKSMACDNQGYYVHLTDSAAVREKVLNYIPVMARPLVLGKHEHPIIWTEVYADYVDQQMTDWLWCVKQDDEQRQDFINFRERGESYFFKEEEEKRYFAKLRKNEELFTESDKYQFMTTVAMPVYDRRENANITEDVLINEAYWESQTRETRIANILGVAGTDIPIRDIKKLLLPFMLGPNGYGFIVTNNGFVLLHPDFRPIFQGDILKPSYNSVDMIELELLDDDRDPRDFDNVLLGIRDSIINQSTGSKWLLIKQHYDDMKRVTRMKRQYYWAPITNTPFTLVITYPEPYGNDRIQYRIEEDIHRLYLKGINVSSFFSGNWKIHPDWLYCKHSNLTFLSPESELLYFLNKMSRSGWKWPLSRTSLPPEHTAAMYYKLNRKSTANVNTSSGRTSSSSSDKESSYSYSSYYCDRNLVQSLAFDARVTEWFSKNTSFNSKDDKGPIAVLMGLLPRNEFKQRFGITVTFLATHSGLTRWQEFYSNVPDEMRHLPDFNEKNRRSIDEIWYKRAVEQYFIESQSFVFSVPHNSGENPNETLVTASHAIFHTEGGKSAPAAVVGFQFQHSALYTLFKNITNNCADCSTTCSSDGINCFILDNNGYVIISPNLADTGKFFGEVNGQLMFRLIQDKVYKEVVIYDYQAICFEENSEESGSGFLYSPIVKIFKYMKYIFKTILWYIVRLQLVSSEPAMDHYFDENMTDYGANNKEWLLRVTLRRTRLMGCDTRRHLYTLYNEKNNAAYEIPASGCERPYVVYPIPASNLIMLVADMLCPQDPSIKIYTYPVEINYNYGENSSFACYKSQNPELPRVRPTSCINKHMNESSIELCGDGNNLLINHILILMPIIIYRFL